ncbi:M protein [Helicobacter pylori]|uniref:M protein n=1 Tax=Helicobacter pylori TaxID=210 RepID=UPI003BAD9A90
MKKLEDLKLEDFELLRKLSHFIGNLFGKSSNDTQENPKDAQKKEEELKKAQEENTTLNQDKNDLARERDKLTKDKENLTATLSTAKTQAEQTSQKLNELEQRHAPYQKLEKLYEVFLEVKDRLNFNFVATTHSAMDLIASVLSDSKYYLESLYNKARQELSDKRSDKGEKLAELFDLLFEYIKDSKFERLKEPSAYDYSCKTLYPEQNTSQKMQRVVLRGYKHNDKVYHTIVDMGS